MVATIVIVVIIAILIASILFGTAVYHCCFSQSKMKEEFNQSRRKTLTEMNESYARQELHNRLLTNATFNPYNSGGRDSSVLVMGDSVSVAKSSVAGEVYFDTRERPPSQSSSQPSHFYPQQAMLGVGKSNEDNDVFASSGHANLAEVFAPSVHTKPASDTIRFSTVMQQPAKPTYEIAVVELGFTATNHLGFTATNRNDSIPIANGILSRNSGCAILSYSPSTHDQFVASVEKYDAIIVRFDPSTLHQTAGHGAMNKFDQFLVEQEQDGKLVFTSPSVRSSMQSRDALVKIKDLVCGLDDTAAYTDADSFAQGLKVTLAHSPRVIKRNDGMGGGHGIWLCWLEDGHYCAEIGQTILDGSEVIKLMEMSDNHVEYHTLDEFISFCVSGIGDFSGEWTTDSPGGYLTGQGKIIDQQLLKRVMEGKVQLVMVGDTLHEIKHMDSPTGLSVIESLAANSRSFTPGSPEFLNFERSFMQALPDVAASLEIDPTSLPLLWTVDLIPSSTAVTSELSTDDTKHIVCGFDCACVSLSKLQVANTLADVSDDDYWNSVPLANKMATKVLELLAAKEQELAVSVPSVAIDEVTEQEQEQEQAQEQERIDMVLAISLPVVHIQEQEQVQEIEQEEEQEPLLFWHQMTPLQQAIQKLREKSETAMTDPKRTALVLDLLTKEYLDSLAEKQQAQLLQCCREAIDFPEFCQIGCRVRHSSDYDQFEGFFKTLITAITSYPVANNQPPTEWSPPSTGSRFTREKKSAKNFRTMQEISIHVNRNVEGFPMASKMTKADRLRLEDTVVRVLTSSENPHRINGVYRSFTPGHAKMMTETEYQSLCEMGAAFPHSIKDSEEMFGATRDWPHGRGCFISNELTIWIGLQDHLQIRCTKHVLTTEEIRSRVEAMLRMLQSDIAIKFQHSATFGWLTSSPAFVGTGISKCALGIVLPASVTLQDVKDVTSETLLKGQMRQQFDNATAWTFDNIVAFGVTEGTLLHRLETAVTMFEKLAEARAIKHQNENTSIPSPGRVAHAFSDDVVARAIKHQNSSIPSPSGVKGSLIKHGTEQVQLRPTQIKPFRHSDTTTPNSTFTATHEMSVTEATAHLLKRSASVKQRVEHFLQMDDSDDSDHDEPNESIGISNPIKSWGSSGFLSPPSGSNKKIDEDFEVSSVYSFDASATANSKGATTTKPYTAKPKPLASVSSPPPPPPPPPLSALAPTPIKPISNAPKRKLFDLIQPTAPVEEETVDNPEPEPVNEEEPTPNVPEFELDANGKPIAPQFDNKGQPIPEWRQKIKQKRLDIEFQQKKETEAEHQANEDRWIGVPAWKRAMLEKKEKEQGRTDFTKP